jgi:MFS family permease
MLLVAVGTFGIFDAATLSLLPVYGVQNGLSVATAANVLTALIIGNMVLQLPIGWLCDRFPTRNVLAGCALVTSITLVLLPAAMHTMLLWPLLVVMGTTGYGVYTVSLVALGNRFSGSDLISGSAAFALVWGGGALFGSISGGMVMLFSGIYGLPFSLSVIYLVLAIGVIWRQISLRESG